MKSLLLAVAAALLFPAAAGAHLSVRPSVLEAGEEVTLRIELPPLRPGVPPDRLDVAGGGIETLSSRRAGRFGDETRWLVRIRVEAAEGLLVLRLRARYPDGRSVEVRQTVTVVPASSDDSDQGAAVVEILAAAVAGTLGVAALGLYLRARRARLSEAARLPEGKSRPW